MAYTAPTTRSTGDLITASIYNTDLVDNIAALKDPPSNKYTFNDSADWQTSSATFGNIDADLSLAITTTGGAVMLGFLCTTTSSSGQIFIDFTIDGTRHGGDDGLIRLPATLQSVGFVFLITGLSATSHTFVMQWKVSAGTATMYAGAGTASNDVHGQFWVREVS